MNGFQEIMLERSVPLLREDRRKLPQIQASSTFRLWFHELDAGLNWKMRSVIDRTQATTADFLRDKRLNLAAMRRRGLVGVLAHAQFAIEGVALPVDGEVEVTTSLRVCNVSALERPRLAFVSHVEFHAKRGTGSASTSLDVEDGASHRVAWAKTVLPILNLGAPADDRVLHEPPPELGHLEVHEAPLAAPGTDALTRIPEGYLEVGASSETVVWGLQHSDLNQHVNTGEYLNAAEDASTRVLSKAQLDTGAYRTDWVCTSFKRPFLPGSVATLNSRAYAKGDRTLVVVSFHATSASGEVDPRAAVVVRLEGGTGRN
jgi:hypothetical protein